MRTIAIGYKVMPKTILKYLPRYAVYKYINKKIPGATVEKLLYDLY